jgi:hypothetical protein
VFIHKPYFALEAFAGILEVFSSKYLDMEVLEKMTAHWLVTEIQDTGIVCVR